MDKKIVWITRTGVLTALLIVMQAVTSSFGNTLITGSIVNLMLIISVMTCGLATGLTVAILSPFFAKLFGIGPLWSLIPFIIAGNIILILIWHFIGKRKAAKPITMHVIAMVIASISKFAVLYLTIVKIAVPILLKLPEPQANVISATFSIPQLFTAAVGGTLSILILPILNRVINEQP